MDIQKIQHDNDSKHRFYVNNEAGKTLAEMTYTWAGSDKFIIDHTHVDDSLRGTGTGKQLVYAAVDYAREKNLKIIPLCPFAKVVIHKDKSLQDVL